jgi:hypothetical protein
LNPARIVFNVESKQAHDLARMNLPPTVDFNSDEPGYDAGVEVSSGSLTGAMIFYNSSEPMTPRFGPLNDVEPILLANGDKGVGVPANLLPHTVFDSPVKIFLPCPGVADVSQLMLCHYNGQEWQLAADEYGNILPGGEGWMVPGSRVNHNDVSPPLIEVQVHHFSAAQAVGSVSTGDSTATVAVAGSSGGGGGGGGGGGCFIGSAGQGFNALWVPAGLFALILCLLPRLNPLRSFSTKIFNRVKVCCPG